MVNSTSDWTGVEEEDESSTEAMPLSRLLFQALLLGVKGKVGVEQLEGVPELELGLL